MAGSGGIGIYGKVPGLGDFFTRRLPATFTDVMDGWLQEAIHGSKEVLGESWLHHYLAAPMWRFGLGAGVAGNEAWIGVLVASVDRVGRYFPLVLTAPIAAGSDLPASFERNSGWLAALEDAADAALQYRADAERLEALLASIAAPAGVPAAAGDGDQTLPLPRSNRLALSVTIDDPAAAEGWTAVARQMLSGIDHSGCLWHAAIYGEPPRFLVTEGLPGPRQFCAMLSGQWLECGWEMINGAAAPLVEWR